MSVYKYKCPKCGEKFEIPDGNFTGSNDKEACPNCGFNQVERDYSSICTESNPEETQTSNPQRHFG
jgi:putative FmdB family regulatory protein